MDSFKIIKIAANTGNVNSATIEFDFPIVLTPSYFSDTLHLRFKTTVTSNSDPANSERSGAAISDNFANFIFFSWHTTIKLQ